MKIKGSTALVTGANRGLGLAFVRALREAGCSKIYAAARQMNVVPADGIINPIQLDICNSEHVVSTASQCRDVDLLINNAGIAAFAPALGAPTIDSARREMETNYFGTLAMCRAFAPILKHNGGGTLVNILSTASWFGFPMQGSYCASKAAEWSLTMAIRFELREQGTLVVGVYAGYIDTDMTAELSAPKSRPESVVARVLAGIENNEAEILADERAQSVHSELLRDYGPFAAKIQNVWDDYKRRKVGN
jgi:NAD(P)-dependent dehydrogenase (short-subunit alcohol dehydrogenase family)